MNDRVCKFCHLTKLLCQSHVISEFVYEPLYDDKHRALVAEAGANLDKPPKMQSVASLIRRQDCRRHTED
jgi:hypothetical protein